MAGASLKWNCPVYASTSFFNRKIPERWPSAIKCKQNLKSVKNWTYSKNQIRGIISTRFKNAINIGVGSERLDHAEKFLLMMKNRSITDPEIAEEIKEDIESFSNQWLAPVRCTTFCKKFSDMSLFEKMDCGSIQLVYSGGWE